MSDGYPKGIGGSAELAALELARDPVALALCQKRLERALGAACPKNEPWPARVVAGIAAALRFAAGDPIASRALTLGAAGRRVQGQGFERMIGRFAALLMQGAPPAPDPDRTAHVIVRRIARQVLLQLERRPPQEVIEIAPELVAFALVPYVGFAEAQRWTGKVMFQFSAA